MSKFAPFIEGARSATRKARIIAVLWLLAVCAFSLHNLVLWTGDRLQIDTDVLAMLPQNERDPAVQAVTRQLADAASRRIVVLVGGRDWPAVQHAADAYAATLAQAKVPVAVRYQVGDAAADQWLDFFAPHRHQLLSPEQRQLLRSQTPQQLADLAVESLYRPLGMPRLGEWRDDPLNLFGGWLSARAGDSKVRVTNGRLSLADGERQYALLMLEQQGPAFSISAQQALMPLLAQAKAASLAGAANIEVLTIGVPLYAAAAANQAEREVHVIGFGSLAGIIVLTLFAFRTIRPRILVTLSIAIGLLTAISVCALVFGKLHLITLVFGASLVGVAENYGTNYFSNRLDRPSNQRWQMLREQAPVMWLAMLTTAIGYALLALTPFPGLRQIAVFSAVGLLAAFVTVLWWFPFLDGGEMEASRFSQWIGSRRAFWPVLGRNRFTVIAASVLLITLAAGAWKLRANDDIRLLQNSPPDLIAQQIAVSRLLDLPSPAQFYLVRGTNAEEVLQREEALKAQLAPLVSSRWISGVQAVSDWVPSMRQQSEDATLLHSRINGEGGADGVLALASAKLGEAMTPSSVSAIKPLQIDAWLAAPVSEPLRYQWLGPFDGGVASVILLRGVDQPAKLAKLGALADNVPGVRWVDKVAEVSNIMGRYRVIMAGVIVLGYLLVFAALSRRFGRRAWRALVPTAIASALALALQAMIGQPLQLFNVLALLLILGMGVDYGIFMLEQPGRKETRAFLSITLAAACTLLSFGLLALSGTPALRAFGLTMLLGIGFAWLLTPSFMPVKSHTNRQSP
ncbi:MAG: MMPL family transporter [Pseudomonadota bacterium]